MKIYSADFETTVYEGQDHTEVWASALVALDSDEPVVHHSIQETLDYLNAQKEDAILYYHNLKFDGNFWLSYLMYVLEYKQAFEKVFGKVDKNQTWGFKQNITRSAQPNSNQWGTNDWDGRYLNYPRPADITPEERAAVLAVFNEKGKESPTNWALGIIKIRF